MTGAGSASTNGVGITFYYFYASWVFLITSSVFWTALDCSLAVGAAGAISTEGTWMDCLIGYGYDYCLSDSFYCFIFSIAAFTISCWEIDWIGGWETYLGWGGGASTKIEGTFWTGMSAILEAFSVTSFCTGADGAGAGVAGFLSSSSSSLSSPNSSFFFAFWCFSTSLFYLASTSFM